MYLQILKIAALGPKVLSNFSDDNRQTHHGFNFELTYIMEKRMKVWVVVES